MIHSVIILVVACCGAYIARWLSRRISSLESRLLLLEETASRTSSQDVAVGIDLTDRLAYFQRMKFSPSMVKK